jgi:hypothetical protein
VTGRRLTMGWASILSAAVLTAGLSLAAVTPARAATTSVFTEIRDSAGDYLNFWNGGELIRTYDGATINNWITIQWLPGGGFQLVDGRHGDGSCVGDAYNSPYNSQMSGGLNCPSDGNAGWGTVFYVYAQCSGGTSLFKARHWPNGFVGFTSGSNHPVYENTSGICLKQTG